MAAATASLPQAAYQLGEPLRTYQATGKATSQSDLIGMFAAAAGFLALLAAIAGISEGQTILTVIGAPVALICGGVMFWAYRKNAAAARPTLLLTEQGVVYVEGEKITALKWEEIDGLSANSSDSYRMGKHQYTFHSVRIQNSLGKVLISLTGIFPDIIEIKDALTQKVLPLVQPRILERFERGERVVFTTYIHKGNEEVSLNKQGVTVLGKTIPWNQINSIALVKHEAKTNDISNIETVAVLDTSASYGKVALGSLAMLVNYPILETLVNQHKVRA